MIWYAIVGGFIFCLFLWLVYRWSTKQDKPIPHKTYYFCVYNEDNVKSCNHDSGIKPSISTNIITLKILKTEYNDGKSYQVNKITKCLVGRHYQDMKEVGVNTIKDLGDMFEVVVKVD